MPRDTLTRLSLPIAVAMGLLLAAGHLEAQAVVGNVVEEGTRRPLAGAFLQLETPAGDRVGGVLSGDVGDFVLRAPGPGRYRVVAELIGYAGTESEWVTLVAETGVRMTLEVPVRAVSLDGITARAGERCRRRPGSGPATAALWEEARKALRVASWARQENVLRFQVVEHLRELDARSLEVLSHEESGRTGFYDQSPFASVPAERLEADGYVQKAPDDTWDYFAPDADVLLSESFLDTHCFRVVPPAAGHPGLMGLGFEPVPERDVPDIEGVLWLDEGTAELRRIEYHYVGLPAAVVGGPPGARLPARQWPQVGGEIEFARLATGMWVVRSWRIRMPYRASEIRGQGPPTLELVSLLQQGAVVRSVRTRDGTLLSEASGATVYGVVTGPDGAPLADATVAVPRAGQEVRTGPEGGYRITGLPAGNWALELRHPMLELTGLGPQRHTAQLHAGQATRVPMTLGLGPDRALAICSEAGWDADRGRPVFIYGSVRSPDGTLVPGGLVRIEADGGERRLMADSTGTYRACLPASPGPAFIAAVARRDATRDLNALDPWAVELDTPGFVQADLVLTAGDDPTSIAVPDVRSALVGRVVDHASGQPVADVTVVLRDTAGLPLASQVSDGDGSFRIAHPGAGDTFRLSAEHVAFATSQGRIDFPQGERVRMEVLLDRRVIAVDPIVVQQRRRGVLVDVGFYDRRERGQGFFLDREDIDRRGPVRVTDLLRGRSRVRVVELPSGESDVRVVQQVSFHYEPGHCQPAVWIDGNLAREGGLVRIRGVGEPIAAAPLSQLIRPQEVEGLELYTGGSGVPARFASANATCGSIVFWTRPDSR